MAQPPAIEKLLLAVSRRGRVIVRFSGKGCGGKSRPSTSSSLSNPLGGLRSFFDTTTNVWAFFVAKRLFWSPSNLQARSSGRHRGIKEAFFSAFADSVAGFATSATSPSPPLCQLNGKRPWGQIYVRWGQQLWKRASDKQGRNQS